MNARSSDRNDTIISVCLAAIAVAWALPVVLTPESAQWVGGEHGSTARYIKRTGSVPVYLLGQDYMGVLQSLLSALVMSVLGETQLALRLPGVVLHALGAVLYYRIACEFLPRYAAVCFATILACPVLAVSVYFHTSQPEYPSILLLQALLVLATIAVDRDRAILSRWVMFGIIGGLALYEFRISVAQLGACLIWLVIRSSETRHLIARSWSGRRERCSLFVLGAVGLVGFGALAVPGYRYLTRTQTYFAQSFTNRDFFLALVGVVCLSGIALLLTVRLRRTIPWRELSAFLLVVGGIPASLDLYYRSFQREKLLREPIVERNLSVRFDLRHAHEWPATSSFFLGEIVPYIYFGSLSEWRRGDQFVSPPVLRVVGIALLVVLCLFVAVRATITSKTALRDTSIPWLLIGGALLLTCLLVPTWRLHGVASYRYLVPYVPGFYLLIFLPFLVIFRERKAGVVVFSTLYVMWSLVTNLCAGFRPNPW